MKNDSTSLAHRGPAPFRHRLPLIAFPAVALLLFSVLGCEDDLFAVRWVSNPDTVRLYALSRTDSNLFSGYDFHPRNPVQIEAPRTGSEWDLAVDTMNGEFVWLPPGALGIASSSGLATLEGENWEQAVRAPSDTLRYSTREPVPMRTRTVYVIRTRAHSGLLGTQCNYYGKVEPLAINVLSGWVVFRYDMSRACNSRDLVPPG